MIVQASLFSQADMPQMSIYSLFKRVISILKFDRVILVDYHLSCNEFFISWLHNHRRCSYLCVSVSLLIELFVCGSLHEAELAEDDKPRPIPGRSVTTRIALPLNVRIRWTIKQDGDRALRQSIQVQPDADDYYYWLVSSIFTKCHPI